MEMTSAKDDIDPAGSWLCIGSIHFWITAVGFIWGKAFKIIKTARTDRPNLKNDGFYFGHNIVEWAHVRF